MKKKRSYFACSDYAPKIDYKQLSMQYPRTPLLIESKALFQVPDAKRKTCLFPTRKSIHQNRSPIQSQMQERRKPDQFVQVELITQIQGYQKLNQDQQFLIEQLQEENEKLLATNTKLNQQLDDLKISLNLARQNDDGLYYERQLKELKNIQEMKLGAQNYQIQTLQKQVEQLTSKLDENHKETTKSVKFCTQLQNLESLCIEMQKLIICKFCHKEIVDAITVIPCAHSYCKGCRKGYHNKCYICGDEQRIEAIYINQFMSQMTDLYRKNYELIKLFK